MTEVLKQLLAFIFLTGSLLTIQSQRIGSNVTARHDSVINFTHSVKQEGKLENDIVGTIDTLLDTDRGKLNDPKTTKETKNPDKTCNLRVHSDSQNLFTSEVEENKYNFMYLKLQFLDNTTIDESDQVINGFNWAWTFKDEDGGYQYLFLASDFGYSSFGLLWSYTRTEVLDIKIKSEGNCGKLKIGNNDTDKLIGNAFDVMTSHIASFHVQYNHSYWCYKQRRQIDSSIIYWLCSNSICTFQTTEYKCCNYVIYLNRTRTVECGDKHFHYGALWWILPIIVGEILFGFYPIFLTKLGIKFTEWSKAVKRSRSGLTQLSSVVDSANCIERKYHFITLTDNYPVTFLSTILSPLYQCITIISGPVLSRMLRLWLILFPVTISTVRVLMNYKFNKEFIIAAVEKKSLLGFSSLIAGPNAAREVFLTFLDGPITALILFFAFSSVLILFPKHLEKTIQKGLSDGNPRHYFLITIPLTLKEIFSGIVVRKYDGYRRLHYLFISQSFMLLQSNFWRYACRLFYTRWVQMMCPQEMTSGESANAFGESYRELLKVSISVVRKIFTKHGHNQTLYNINSSNLVGKRCLHKDLFFFIICKLRPRRNQLMIALVKFISVVTVLTVSVELLISFNKLQELSLLSHVFTVLFVCALPKIIRMVCLRRYQVENRMKLRKNIETVVFIFLKQLDNNTVDEYEEIVNIDDNVDDDGESSINSLTFVENA
ncbi:hypothetical protein ACF0H5_001916 [Mactra antiquata]